MWAGWRSSYSDRLRAGRSGDRIPVGARFFAPVQTGPAAHPASCTMGTRSFQGVKSGRGVTLTPHPLLVPWSRKGRAIPLLPLWAVRPVQSLSACTRVTFTFYFTRTNRNNIDCEEEGNKTRQSATKQGKVAIT
jgi:DNA-binding transcriptional LysR family regulator